MIAYLHRPPTRTGQRFAGGTAKGSPPRERRRSLAIVLLVRSLICACVCAPWSRRRNSSLIAEVFASSNTWFASARCLDRGDDGLVIGTGGNIAREAPLGSLLVA